MQKRTNERLKQIETLTGALSDMPALDFTVKMLMERDTPMTKEEFRARLQQARLSRKVTQDEVDLLFETMDIQKDGVLFRDDFKSIKKVSETHERRFHT